MIDFNSSSSSPLLEFEGDLVLQQIDMLFDTRKGDVLGEYNYGTDFERFLWNLQISNNAISRYVENVIRSTIDLLGFNLDVNTTILYGTSDDIILIQVGIRKYGYTQERTYRI